MHLKSYTVLFPYFPPFKLTIIISVAGQALKENRSPFSDKNRDAIQIPAEKQIVFLPETAQHPDGTD